MRLFLVFMIVLSVAFASGNPFYNESAIKGKYFECYADCHWPDMTTWLVGCEINQTVNGTERNIVLLGSKQTKYFSHEYYTNGLREDLWCYYSVPISNVTGTEKGWKYVDTKNGNGAPNITGPQPPPQHGNGGPLNAPGVRGALKNPIRKQANIEMKKNENLPGKPNEKFVPAQVTTPSDFKATHFTCPTECPKVEGEYLVRCSILYNFKGRDNIGLLVQAPYMRTSMLDVPLEAGIPGSKVNSSETIKRSKVWTKDEGGKRIYDEVLVCEYVKEQGKISYAEPQTPYDRLGYMEPPSLEDLERALKEANESSGEFEHNESTCRLGAMVTPPGYANINGTSYEVDDSTLDWAKNCVALEEYDYGVVQFLNLMDESSVLHGLLAQETVEVIAPGFEGCVKFGERIEEAVSGEIACGELGEETAMVYISEDALARLQNEDPATVVEEEWGSGITYEAFGISGIAKKIGAEIMILIARLF
jgi:hypothetical protein